jgi:glycosyltransferase involved in cell wall biosynthesis
MTTGNAQRLILGTNETVPLADGEGSTKNYRSQAPIRIAIIASHPIQYFAPWFRSLAATPGIVLKVFFCSKLGAEPYYDKQFGREVKWDIPLLEGYDWEVLEARKEIKSQTFWSMDNPKVGRALEMFQPDIVEVNGYAYRTMWRVVVWCNRNMVPVMIYSDSNRTPKRALWKRAAKGICVKQFYRHLDGALSSGDNNRMYHLHYGIPPARIFTGIQPIDCERLVASVGNAVATRREIRQRHGIPEDAFVVVYAGKLIPVKCPLHLLEAILRCAQHGLNVWGLLVGEGEERQAVEAFIAKHKMDNIVLAGFVNQSSIGKYYAASDVVTLMSRHEPKGQTVPEAGAVGCPAILSDRIGCIGPNDCARPGENALVYPWSDIDAFTNCIVRLYQDRLLQRSMSKAAVRIANSQDIAVAALQMKEAATQLKKMGRRI